MTLFAQFDHTAADPKPVTGWYDTSMFDYGSSLPDASNLLELTEDQWNAHFTPPGTYAINAGTIEPYTLPPPVLTLAEQAQSAMYSGLHIALTGSVTLASTLFPVDPEAQRKLTSVCTAASINGSFPGGGNSFPLRDSGGTWHTFTWDVYKVIATAVAAYAAGLDLIMDGNPLNATVLPSNSVTLTV